MKEKVDIDIDYAKSLFDIGLSMHKIAEMLNCSFTKVQKELNSYDFNKNNPYKLIEGKQLIAICKETGKEISDYDNRSGAITNHLLNLYQDLEIPSHYKRKDILYKTFKYWYHDYFEFEYRDIKSTVKCKYCDWETEDVDNIAGAYMNHMLNIHNIDIDEHLDKYPEDNKFFKNYIRKKEREEYLDDTDNHVECKICGKKLKKITQSHLNLHNIKLWEYREKYKNTISNTVRLNMLDFYEKTLRDKGFTKVSKWEKEINDFINELGIYTIQSCRSILDQYNEIDIYIPDFKIGIECNGLYYHSEIRGNKHKNYHKVKTVTANSKDVTLLQIFEDEWHEKKDIIKSKLINLFNLGFNKKIYARKCQIKKISPAIKNLFLNKNHIQGEDRSTIYLGAYYNNELVSVMTFDNNRSYNKEKNHNKNIYELKRFATKLNYNVVGIGSKMFKYFLDNYNSKRVVSFLDLRWSNINKQNIYEILGFKKEKILNPDYNYLNFNLHRNKRFHKFAFGKKSLKKKFPQLYSEDKTEWEIMQEAGYDRIWDCGKIKYTYEHSTPV
jgi:hypothetical protein